MATDAAILIPIGLGPRPCALGPSESGRTGGVHLDAVWASDPSGLGSPRPPVVTLGVSPVRLAVPRERMRSHAALRRRRLCLRVLGVAGVAVGAAVAALVLSDLAARGESARSGFGDHVPTLVLVFGLVFGTVVGWIFVWSGLKRPDIRTGALMVAIGCVCPLAVSALAREPVLFSLGTAFGNLYIAFTAHLLLAFPAGRLRSHGDRLIVAGSYLATLVLLPLASLFADFARLGCGACPPNALMVADEEAAAGALSIAASIVLASVALALIFALISSRDRRWLGAGLVAFGVATVTPLTGSSSDLTLAIGAVGFLGFANIPGFLGTAEDVYERPYPDDRAFGALVARFCDPPLAVPEGGQSFGSLSKTAGPGPLSEALARVLGDSSLELAYWLHYSMRYVDVHGQPVAIDDRRPGRALCEVRLEGRPPHAATLHPWRPPRPSRET